MPGFFSCLAFGRFRFGAGLVAGRFLAFGAVGRALGRADVVVGGGGAAVDAGGGGAAGTLAAT